jgi:hypothetical protein
VFNAGCEKAWYDIVKHNASANKDLTFINQLNDYKGLNAHLKEFILVRAYILKLMFVVDDEALTYLKKKGYAIDDSGRTAYADSLTKALKKSESINAKISTRKNSMLKKYGVDEDNFEQAVYEELVVSLNAALGFTVTNGTDLKLCEYNAYKEVLKKRNKKAA